MKPPPPPPPDVVGVEDARRFLAADSAAFPLIFVCNKIITCNNTLILYYFRIFILIGS